MAAHPGSHPDERTAGRTRGVERTAGRMFAPRFAALAITTGFDEW
ncbi:hypothetical protein [Mycobacterium haemophilum]|nr:hypothetical protein [Mycobacterium haemophilum]